MTKQEVEPTISVFQTTQNTTPSTQIASRYYSEISGTEYEYPIAGSHNHNVPCAVCYVATRDATVMIPARTSCPPNWTREYYDYLQSEAVWPGRQHTEYVCVEKTQVSVRGSHANINEALIYHVRATCNGIVCLPYNTI